MNSQIHRKMVNNIKEIIVGVVYTLCCLVAGLTAHSLGATVNTLQFWIIGLCVVVSYGVGRLSK